MTVLKTTLGATVPCPNPECESKGIQIPPTLGAETTWSVKCHECGTEFLIEVLREEVVQ